MLHITIKRNPAATSCSSRNNSQHCLQSFPVIRREAVLEEEGHTALETGANGQQPELRSLMQTGRKQRSLSKKEDK